MLGWLWHSVPKIRRDHHVTFAPAILARAKFGELRLCEVSPTLLVWED